MPTPIIRTFIIGMATRRDHAPIVKFAFARTALRRFLIP
jgi:hypothetical protein